MTDIIGYDLVNGELVINIEEVEFIKYIYARFEQYSVSPPNELVIEIYEEEIVNNPEFSMEMAKTKAKESSRIYNYIIAEANSEFSDDLLRRIKEKLETHKMGFSYIHEDPNCFRGKIQISEIIDNTVYEEVQRKQKGNSTNLKRESE